MDRLLSNGRIIAGGITVMVIIFAALMAPILAPYDPTLMNPSKAFAIPGLEYFLGTDEFGRDIFSRLIFGVRISVQIAIYSVLISCVFGVLSGAIAAYIGGFIGNLIMRIMDVLLSIPPIIFAIAVFTFIGSGVPHIIFAIAILYTPRFSRIAYSTSMSVKENDYVKP